MDNYIEGSFNNRTLCGVLEEMRACLKALNLAPLRGLIEEAQSMGNRMEAGLSDKHDLESMLVQKSKLKAEIKKLFKEKEAAAAALLALKGAPASEA